MKSFWLVLMIFALTVNTATQISKSENNLDVTVTLEENPFKALGENSKDIQDIARILFRTELEANGVKVVTINPDWKIVTNAVQVGDNYIIAPVMSNSMDNLLNRKPESNIYIYVYSEILEGDNLPLICRISVSHFIGYLKKIKKLDEK